MAEVYFTPGRVGVSWEIVVELAKAGSRSLMIRLARPTLTEVPLAGLSAVPPEQRPTEIEHASVIRSRPRLPVKLNQRCSLYDGPYDELAWMDPGDFPERPLVVSPHDGLIPEFVNDFREITVARIDTVGIVCNCFRNLGDRILNRLYRHRRIFPDIHDDFCG